MKQTFHVLWAPEIIRELNGIACGDQLSLHAFYEQGCIFFQFYGNACEIAVKVCRYLEEIFSGENEEWIRKEIERFRNFLFLENEQWISEAISERKNCVEAPIALLYSVIERKYTYETDEDKRIALSCDACVSNPPLNWKPVQKTQKKILPDLSKQNYDRLEEIELQQLGLCVLSEEQQEKFEKKLSQINMEDFKRIKKLRLPTLLYNSAGKYGFRIDPKIEELAVKQIVSLAIASEEIKIIEDFICKNNLKLDAVKGGKTNSFYPQGYYRTHMDFDYLSQNFEDAFRLISYLINERNFKMVVGGSVPFSLKSVLNQEKREILTGHIHLEKILQNQYQVVIDINMGGFPLGRTGIIQCNQNGKLTIEDLICITISHLFKHEHAFMKDINDLYYILTSGQVDWQRLQEKIVRYSLTNLFWIVMEFFKNNMGLKFEVELKPNFEIQTEILKRWPFSREAHYKIKKEDMDILNRQQFGEEIGKRETQNQVLGLGGVMKSIRYHDLCDVLNQRVYLYPVLIFKEYIQNLKRNDFLPIEDTILRYDLLLILPVGIFLIQIENQNIDRSRLNQDISFVLDKLSLSDKDCNVSYVMEARMDTWLY